MKIWAVRVGWGAGLLALHALACSSSTNRGDDGSAAAGQAGTGQIGSGGADAGSGGSDTPPGGSGGALGGSGGDVAGAAGEAGAAGAPGCTSHAECDDGNPCNGAEQCVDGSCVDGAAQCGDYDRTYCDCVGASGGGCEVAGLDRDDDHHRDPLCAAAPGDDCDDTNPNAHPGLAEYCDGIDNDCNGLVDLEDGLQPAGSWEIVSYNNSGQPDVASASGVGTYGVVWSDFRDGVGADIYFRSVNADGTMAAPEEQISSSSDTDDSWPQIAWNGTVFGIAWSALVQSSGTSAVYFAMVSPDGTLLRAPTLLASEASLGEVRLAPTAEGDFIAFYLDWVASETMSVTVPGADPGAAPLAPEIVDFQDQRYNLAAAGSADGYAVLGYGTDSGNNVSDLRWIYQTGAFPTYPIWLQSTADTGDSSQFGLVAAAYPGSFLFAWSTMPSGGGAERHWMAASRIDGSSVCGPTEVISAVAPTGVAPAGAGYVLLGKRYDDLMMSYENMLQIVDGDCSSQAAPVSLNDYSEYSDPQLAAGDSGYAIVWEERVADSDYRISSRVLGPLLCN